MQVLEMKLYGKPEQFVAIDEALRTFQFIRNKALRTWMNSKGTPTKENATSLYRLSKTLAKEFTFVKPLNSSARQAATERAWSAITRFFDKTSKFPRFQKDNRSVEFKQSGWKLSKDYKKITFPSCGIGTLKMKGTRDLRMFQENKINRVRIVRRADGYYVQFCINCTRTMEHQFNGKAVGIDMGLNHFYTDSEGVKVENPRFLRKSEAKLRRTSRRHSRCQKRSKNRDKARRRLARVHLKVARQRKDFAVKTARQVITNCDFVGIEDLQVRNMVRSNKAKSIHDAGWSMFRNWLEYFGNISGVKVVAVPPHYTSQMCSKCGNIVKKSLSERTHICQCGCVMDRDENAAKNILGKAFEELSTTGHVGINASGDLTSISLTKLGKQVGSLKEESA